MCIVHTIPYTVLVPDPSNALLLVFSPQVCEASWSFVCYFFSLPQFARLSVASCIFCLLFAPTYLTMVRFVTSLLALSATAWAATSCSSSSQCPKDKPCCSRESASYMRPDQWLIHLARVWRMWYGRLLFGWMRPSLFLFGRLLRPDARLQG